MVFMIEIVQDEDNRKLVFVLLNCNLFYAKVNNNFSINRLYTYFYKMALRFIRFREIKTTKSCFTIIKYEIGWYLWPNGGEVYLHQQ